MIYPTIHMNGTARSELIEQYERAVDALQKACDAIRLTSPHGRDYYPQESDAIYKAQDEHLARYNKLSDVRLELKDILTHILDQPDNRR